MSVPDCEAARDERLPRVGVGVLVNLLLDDAWLCNGNGDDEVIVVALGIGGIYILL
jgi:hypothetical protein